MEYLFDNIVRGVITNFLILLNMFIVAEPKYARKVTIIAFLAVYFIKDIIDIYLYLNYNMTIFAKISAFNLIAIGLVLKPLFLDNLMKWMFNIITVINVFVFVVIISYTLSPSIEIIPLIRLIMYSIIIFLFKKYLRPLYRQVADRWHLFLAASLIIMINFLYAIVSTNNILAMLRDDIISLMLMILTMFIMYATIHMLQNSIIKEYEYKSDKQQATLNEGLLFAQLNTYEEFVENTKRYRHDLRHHNRIVMEYLKSGDIIGAEEYLQLYDESIKETSINQYCKNYVANAVLCVYARKALSEKISFKVSAVIPNDLTINKTEIGSMLSNILENAMEACKRVELDERSIFFSAETDDVSLKIELKNTVTGHVKFINGLPVSDKENGGTGMKSVIRIIDKYGGMFNFIQNKDIFITQLVIPI